MENREEDPIPTSRRDGDTTQPASDDGSVTRRYYLRPENLDREKAKRWYEAWKVAREYETRHELLEELDGDALDENAIETRILELSKQIRITNHFCEECHRILDNWPGHSFDEKTKGFMKEPHAVYLRTFHTFAVEAAAQKGCKFCALLFGNLLAKGFLQAIRKVELQVELAGFMDMAQMMLYRGTLWYHEPGSSIHHDSSVEFNIVTAWETESDHYFDRGSTEESDEAADEGEDEQSCTLNIAKNWLNSCHKDHQECKLDDTGPLPTRLVFVAQNPPRLVLTDGWKQRPEYSTLSHCWGSEDFLKLTRSNYDLFKTTIPYDGLPKTFRDAIEITRSIGLQYLWIDSLCIIQGDEQDWEHEAGLMSSVYGGTTVNIAASSATNAHQGCFLKPRYLVDGFRARVCVGGHAVFVEAQNDWHYYQAVEDSHLSTRAWTFQEKLLPSRTIHFGNRGASWECRGLIANEFLPKGIKEQKGILDTFKHIEKASRSCASDVSAWWDIVTKYSHADLTYSQDKLPALSGIAKRVASRHNWKYLAGIWDNSHILEQLCWHTYITTKIRPKGRSPSWVWSSVDDRISNTAVYRSDGNRYHCQVLTAQVDAVSNDPFGAVRGGTLRIRCFGLIAAHRRGTDVVRLRQLGTGEPRAMPVSHQWDDLESETGQTTNDIVYYLPILSEWGNRTHGIILKPTGFFPSQLSRIAYFTTLGQEKQDDFARLVETNGGADAESLGLEVIENDENPQMRYVVTIV